MSNNEILFDSQEQAIEFAMTDYLKQLRRAIYFDKVYPDNFMLKTGYEFLKQVYTSHAPN